MTESLYRRGGGTRIAAVINVSPESFFGGSIAVGAEQLRAAAQAAERDGAAMLDVGAMSTAPYKGAQIPEDEERRRMHEAVTILREATTLPISADTQRLSVARAALEAGANLINDVSSLRTSPALPQLCADYGAGLIIMASEHDALKEGDQSPADVVYNLLARSTEIAIRAGLPAERIILDPGMGFFRNRSIPWHTWDFDLLRHVGHFRSLGYPLLVGASRKSAFKEWLGREAPEDRLAGSLAVAAWCTERHVEWLRVHDVAATHDVIKMTKMLAETDTTSK